MLLHKKMHLPNCNTVVATLFCTIKKKGENEVVLHDKEIRWTKIMKTNAAQLSHINVISISRLISPHKD